MNPFYYKRMLVLQLALVAGFSLFLISRQIFPSPELMLLIVGLLFGIRSETRRFVVDFAPFAVLLICYQALRSYADDMAPGQINIENVIAWERWLFRGIVPAVVVQQALRHQPYTDTLNMVTSMLYMSHFVMPVIMAVVLWFRKPAYYWGFMIGLVVLSLAAYITYVLFPVAPPWWASRYGYLAGDTVVLTNFVFPSVVLVLSPNPVAAMPSLHMAYPAYMALFCTALWGWRALWTWLWPLAIAFSTIYLGHHYVVDLIGGLLYACVCFGGVMLWMHRSNTGSTRSH